MLIMLGVYKCPLKNDKRRCTREQTENTAGIVPCLNAKENYAISAELNTYVASKNEKSLSPRPHSCSNILCEEFSSTTIDVAIILQICPKVGCSSFFRTNPHISCFFAHVKRASKKKNSRRWNDVQKNGTSCNNDEFHRNCDRKNAIEKGISMTVWCRHRRRKYRVEKSILPWEQHQVSAVLLKR